MGTVIGVWVSEEEAFIIERRDGEPSRLEHLARSGAESEQREPPEAFLFRVLDAVHHAHRVLVFGPNGERLRERARPYSFLRERIAGVWADASVSSLPRRLNELTRPAGRQAGATAESGGRATPSAHPAAARFGAARAGA